MSKVILRDIDTENWRQVVNLEVGKDQKNFVANNAISLAQSAYENSVTWYPKAVYVGNDLVGFVMYAVEYYQGKDVWDFTRLMIDEKHQGKGYGKGAVQAVLELMRHDKRQLDDVYISFLPENRIARQLYTQLGFRDVGISPNGKEVLMHMRIF